MHHHMHHVVQGQTQRGWLAPSERGRQQAQDVLGVTGCTMTHRKCTATQMIAPTLYLFALITDLRRYRLALNSIGLGVVHAQL